MEINNLLPARRPFESFWLYKKRRTETNKAIKEHLRGTLIWESKPNNDYLTKEGLPNKGRTYRKEF